MTETRAPAGGWRDATVRSVEHPDAHGVLLRLEIPDRVEHLPGQHYVIRLTAPDGYTAQRSYSIASAPAEELTEFYVERLPDGEVSGFLADVVEPGDRLRVRGPIGGWFVWRGDVPAIGLAGGSGVVPFISMLRHARQLGTEHLLRLAVAARTVDDLAFHDELISHGAVLALSRADTPGRVRGRLAPADLAPLLGPDRVGYVCGSTGFAETASNLLVDAGLPVDRIRIERFGPTG